MSLSLFPGWCSFRMARSPQLSRGAPVLGAAKRTLDSEDRSEAIERQRKANEPLAKGGPAKMAPSLTALNT
jgi:hypothetical protein